MTRYAVVDFETTGFSPERGERAIEIAVVIIDNGQIADSYSSLMNPGIRIPDEIYRVTGISEAMRNGAPAVMTVMREVQRIAQGATLVAHNADFDSKFWEHEMRALGLATGQRWLCTLRLSQRLYSSASDHKLPTLASLLKLPKEGEHHRALADATVTAHLFLRIVSDLGVRHQLATPDLPSVLANYQTVKTPSKRAGPRGPARPPTDASADGIPGWLLWLGIGGILLWALSSM